MNISMGAGLVYIAAWSLMEFTRFLRSARTRYEQGLAGVAMVLYALSGVGGILTVVEALEHKTGVDIALIQQAKAPFAPFSSPPWCVYWWATSGCGRSGASGASCSCGISSRNWCNCATTC